MAIIQLIGVVVIASLIVASFRLEVVIVNLRIRTIMYHQLFIGNFGSFTYEDIRYDIIMDRRGKCILWMNMNQEDEQLCLK
ncbi:hypothetical protein [Culicoidibacter larvae]|uniref:Uncharacterized protein n=1 Tax=Culicoidibacter larvae TaxID=2579976 RepID=A0A5R8QEW1_9FIRM|nr:hypothetical protein [Culicoidibacter larvae]TLG76512.1 hypothetical protein FEZ08_02545 [Culicoidibacter larvae]